MLIVILLLLLIFGGGGGYYAYGPRGGMGIGGIVLVILVVMLRPLVNTRPRESAFRSSWR